MSRVEREFNHYNTRRQIACGYCCVLFFEFVFLFSTCNGHAQWKQVQTFGNIVDNEYPIGVVTVAFNKWGIGFVGTSSVEPGVISIWKSTDSGATWLESRISDSSSQYKQPPVDFVFKDSLTGWFASTDNFKYIPGGGSIYKTTDGGSSWFRIFYDYCMFPVSLHYVQGSGRLLCGYNSGSCSYPVYPAGIMSSTDGGSTWAYWDPIYEDIPPGGFTSIDDSVIYNPSGRAGGASYGYLSEDGGATWQALKFAIENWQPYADTNKKIFYSQWDGGVWNTPPFGFYRSTDLGKTWLNIFGFPETASGWTVSVSGCIRGDSAGNLYVQDVLNGILTSSDSGNTWTGICGPGNIIDTRAFDIVGHYLVAGGSDGSLWRLDLNEKRGVTLDSSLIISAVGCDTISKAFHFGSTFPCDNKVSLDSVSVVGSQKFSSHSELYQLNGIGESDSVIVNYQTDDPYDTAILVFHFVENGVPHDSSVTLYGIGSPPVSISTYIKPTTLTTQAGVTLDIPVYLNGNATLTGMTSITIPLALNSQTLTPVGFIPSAGYSLSGSISYSNGVETVPLQGQDITLSGETQIGILRCIVYLSDTLTTQISLEASTITSVDPRCLSLTSSGSITIALQGCGDSILLAAMSGKPLFTIGSIQPNPAADEITVQLSGDVQPVIEMYDALGRGQDVRSTSLRNGISLDVTNVPSGIYFLRLSMGGYVQSRSVAIQR